MYRARRGLVTNVAALMGGGGGAALWTPDALEGTAEEPYAWFDANNGTYMTLSGSDITQMTDRSGNGRHLSTTTYTDPTYASNMVEVSRLTTKCFDTWAINLGSALWDLFWAGDLDNNVGTRMIAQESAGNVSFFVDASNNLVVFDGGAVRDSAVAWSGTGKRQALIRVKTTSDFEAGVDASAATTDYPLAGVTSTTNAPFVGGNGSAQGFGGLHEWMFLPAGTSGTTKEKIEGYIAWKWDAILGVTTFVDAMPGGHTYKAAAPTL
jgi:hypothetical protein